jgi:hypothetical protein
MVKLYDFFSCFVNIKEGYFGCVLEQDSLSQHVVRASTINSLFKCSCYSLCYESNTACLFTLIIVLRT